MKHFGVLLNSKKYSYKLCREEFALINTKPSLPKFESLVQKKAYTYTDNTASEYSLDWCNEYRELCLKNYDLNMKYFQLLDRQEFDKAIESFLNKYKEFAEIDNLIEYEGVEGYYMMVLDEYKQVYIGKTQNILRRIKQHWINTKPFDRTLFPMYAFDKSCFSIDFFRALDTTRIFVWKRKLSEDLERKLIQEFPGKFLTNRIGGDITSAIEALETMNIRNISF